MKPVVSVIIPFFNCNYIEEAIESVLKQTYDHLEIIIVDDGSDQQYFEKIKPFLKEDIKYFRKENGGTASALNEGINYSKGAYIAWLSSDDVYMPKKIETQIDWMQKNQYWISFTSFYMINENSEIIHQPNDIHLSPRQIKSILMKRNVLNGSTCVFSKELVKNIGLFNERLLYTHDYEFWIRCSQQYEIGYFNLPTVKYRIHPNMGTKKFEEKIILEKNYIKRKIKTEFTRYIQH